MSCRETRRLLSFRREWTPPENVAATTHLASCLACQAIARQYELMDLRLGRLTTPAMEVRLPAEMSRQSSAIEAGAPAAAPAALSLSGGRAAALLALLAAVLLVATVWSRPKGRLVGEPPTPGVASLATQAPPAGGREALPGVAPDAALRSALITHTLTVTENVWSVAQRYGLQPETLLMNNMETKTNGRAWDLGPDLVIPPADGALYTVQPGDTLESVALRHSITVEAISGFELNGLEEPYALQPGQLLMLPGSPRSFRDGLYYESTLFSGVVYPPDAPEGSGTFAWPAQGLLTQGYWSGHYAIDIANDTGTPVLAADHGYVITVGKDTFEYGNQMLIGHGNGFTTRYAHLDTMLVRTGDVVTKGQQIGTMGSTGRATEPHLHFEIIEEGLRKNPMSYLP